MRYIDKAKHRIDGIKNTSEFLDAICKDANGRYSDIRYNDKDSGVKQTFCMADKGKYRKTLTRLLLDNQDGRCCYCLRKLKTAQNEIESDQKITLEHIIPRSFSSSDNVAYYQSVPGLSSNDVEISDNYESVAYIQHKGIHPHKIAYNNLVMSCNGTFPDKVSVSGKIKICCNLARGNKDAYPIYFLKHVDSLVDYLSNGDIQAVPTSSEFLLVNDLICNTNLQADSLKEIRGLWYNLRNENWEDIILSCSSKDIRHKMLSSILYLSYPIEIANNLYIKYNKDDYWNTLMLYSDFYDIMRQKYP